MPKTWSNVGKDLLIISAYIIVILVVATLILGFIHSWQDDYKETQEPQFTFIDKEGFECMLVTTGDRKEMYCWNKALVCL